MVSGKVVLLNIAVGVSIFIATKIILDLFGVQIKEKVKNLLPAGTRTDEGEIING